LINDLNPDFRYYLRPHMLEGWELVCYAVPSARYTGSVPTVAPWRS
jgi:hypothetical protein